MKFTDTINELEDQIRIYETDIKSGYDGESTLSFSQMQWRRQCIYNMNKAIEVLKKNETP